VRPRIPAALLLPFSCKPSPDSIHAPAMRGRWHCAIQSAAFDRGLTQDCGCVSSQNDVQEFHPYVFQIFAQLIETRPAPLPPAYMAIFPPLLSPLFWERPGNVPALVRLLQARGDWD